MQKLTWPRLDLNRWAAPDVLLHLRHTFTGRLVWVICGTNCDLVLNAALALQAVPALPASGESWRREDFRKTSSVATWCAVKTLSCEPFSDLYPHAPFFFSARFVFWALVQKAERLTVKDRSYNQTPQPIGWSCKAAHTVPLCSQFWLVQKINKSEVSFGATDIGSDCCLVFNVAWQWYHLLL